MGYQKRRQLQCHNVASQLQVQCSFCACVQPNMPGFSAAFAFRGAQSLRWATRRLGHAAPAPPSQVLSGRRCSVRAVGSPGPALAAGSAAGTRWQRPGAAAGDAATGVASQRSCHTKPSSQACDATEPVIARAEAPKPQTLYIYIYIYIYIYTYV